MILSNVPMKPTVHIETTIPSLLTAWPSRDVEVAGQQIATREGWEKRRHAFDLYGAETPRRLAGVCQAMGLTLPVLCTPRELMSNYLEL